MASPAQIIEENAAMDRMFAKLQRKRPIGIDSLGALLAGTKDNVGHPEEASVKAYTRKLLVISALIPDTKDRLTNISADYTRQSPLTENIAGPAIEAFFDEYWPIAQSMMNSLGQHQAKVLQTQGGAVSRA